MTSAFCDITNHWFTTIDLQKCVFHYTFSKKDSKLKEKLMDLSHVWIHVNVERPTVIFVCNEGLLKATSHISLVHSLWTVVRRDCRFPSPRGNSPHGSLLQRGCDVPSFNIPWLYNKTWLTSHGTLRPCSPSAHLSLLIFEFLEDSCCILQRMDELWVKRQHRASE